MDFDMMGMEQFHYADDDIEQFQEDAGLEFFQAKPAAKPATGFLGMSGFTWFILIVIAIAAYLYMYKKEETKKFLSTVSEKLKGNKFYYF